MRILQVLLFVFCFMYGVLCAATKGSDSAVSVESFYTFPPTTNQILSFGFFKNGFALQDATTSCSFGSIYPVSGNVSLHGGRLYLGTDLIFQNVTTLGTVGNFYAGGHAIDLCSSITGFSSTNNALFDNATVFLNGDFKVSTTTKINGTCTIDGRWNSLIFDGGGNIIVQKNSSLRLRNVELDNLFGGKIQCVDDSAQIIFDNTRCVFTGNYTFGRGSILFDNNVTFVGPYIFTYASGLTSTINTNATWQISDLKKMVMGRKSGIYGREPLYFTDATACLMLDNCTLSLTSSGANLKTGITAVNREVVLEMNGTSTSNGLMLGDGTSAHDLTVRLYPNAAIKLSKGFLVNNLTNANNLSTADVPVHFVQSGNSNIYLKQNVNYSNVQIALQGTGGSILDPGVALYYGNATIATPYGSMIVTGTRYDPYTTLLNGGGSITLLCGVVPFATLIANSNNSMHGLGDVAAPIILSDQSASLSLGMQGSIDSDITLNGGSVLLAVDTCLGKDCTIGGPGTIDLNQHALSIRLQSKTLTSTLVFAGSGGSLLLDTDMHLASPLSFSGDCVLDGHGSMMVLHGGAMINVKANSTLYLKNLILNGVGGSSIRCQTDTAKIVFENVAWVQSSNVTFTRGSIDIIRNLDMSGSYTFAFQSQNPVTIYSNSALGFASNFTFSYDPIVNRNDLIKCVDATSLIKLNNATLFASKKGLNFQKGKLRVKGLSIIRSDGAASSSGISFGNKDGVNDCVIDIAEGSNLQVLSGYFTYKNSLPSSFKTANVDSRISMYKQTNLRLDQNLTIGRGSIFMSTQAKLILWGGSVLDGTVTMF